MLWLEIGWIRSFHRIINRGWVSSWRSTLLVCFSSLPLSVLSSWWKLFVLYWSVVLLMQGVSIDSDNEEWFWLKGKSVSLVYRGMGCHSCKGEWLCICFGLRFYFIFYKVACLLASFYGTFLTLLTLLIVYRTYGLLVCWLAWWCRLYNCWAN